MRKPFPHTAAVISLAAVLTLHSAFPALAVNPDDGRIDYSLGPGMFNSQTEEDLTPPREAVGPGMSQQETEPQSPAADPQGEPLPQEQAPQEQVPQEQPPQEQVPQESLPQEQPPQEQVPQEPLPQEQPPQEQVPQEQPEPPAQAPLSDVPADVQQRIDAAYVSVTLLRPEQTWTDVIYATPAGASVTAAQGFLSMCLYTNSLPGDVLYRTYSSAAGWSPWVMNGAHSPWNAGVLIEAVQIRISGVINDCYDISYSASLSDGTACGWSFNGDTNGAMGTGQYITGLSVYLTRKGTRAVNKNNDRVRSVTACDGIQFGGGLPTYVNGTGAPYTGWAWDGNERYYFVDNNAVTGWQYIDGYKYYFDESGRLVTDLEPILGAAGPYLIKVNKQMNCTTVYVQDGENGFIIPLKSFLCSTGDDTPIGTFHTPEKFRWHLMIHDVYCQYLTRLGDGLHILLHSCVYDAPDVNALQTDTYNFLSIARSAGCIRFMAKDCKWIYDNCPLRTTIQVYNSSVPGPYERPCVPQLISLAQTWDPTDPEAIAQHGGQ